MLSTSGSGCSLPVDDIDAGSPPRASRGVYVAMADAAAAARKAGAGREDALEPEGE